MIKDILIVGLGGGLGSIFRLLTFVLVAKYYSSNFPLATFIANVFGCFLIGVLIGILGKNVLINNNLKLLLITGFCGGYTTFSTFAVDNVNLLNATNYTTAILYTGVSVVAGLTAVWLGLMLAK